jgi:hypothetical protein
MNYYVCLIKDGITPYAEDEAELRAYMQDIYKIDDPVIYKVDDEKLSKIAQQYCIDMVVKQWGDLYFTDSEAEMVSCSLEDDATDMASSIKTLLKQLKYCDSPASIKLRKALKEFKEEKVDNPDICNTDEFDFAERIMEKFNLTKYTKAVFKRWRNTVMGKDLKLRKKKKGRNE